MRKILFVFFMLPVLVFAQKESGDEVYLFSYFKGNGDGLHLAYSYDGFNWKALKNDSIILKPTVGNDKLMRDPCIIRGADGRFHMVWTVSWSEKGIGYASSPDLIHWSEQQYVPVMAQESAARNAWAPEINWDDQLQAYIIYWATTIPGRFPETDSLGDNNHRIYYVSTRDFKHFSDTKLLYEPGFNVIDATIKKVKKDKYIMFLKDETRKPVQKNLRVAFSDSLTGPYGKPGKPITGKYWAEGPTVLKIGDKWIVYFDKYTEHTMGAVTSTDLANWTDISDKVSFPEGTRHGTVFTVTKQEFDKLQQSAIVP
ncbi:glycoside hydrolase family 43 protein [Pontibacter sp. 172403-2]|uniref:glycoside hydrolase family 43 protein n=1 Tax=Pontibacter rufus TaxID=2791028 RepID=UPI0018AFBB00|nr:glycoside hydrolase family 43 protein [Pontibacter sp. 172403-2]MBF9252847.1 glycoside hydrolase family 43 protein [Pontibacter sp. 172403-2]